MMNIRCSIFISVLLLSFSNSWSQKGYKITGRISGLSDNTKIYLIRADEDGGADTSQFTKAQNGIFRFKGQMKRQGEMHYVKVDTSELKWPSNKNTWVGLLLDHSNILITGTISEWPNAKITGSKATDKFNGFAKLHTKEIEMLHSAISRSPNDTITIKNAVSAYEKFMSNSLIANKAEYFVPYYLHAIQELNLELKSGIYNVLPPAVQSSYYGQALKVQIENSGKQAKIQVGGQIPDFEFAREDGKTENIYSVLQQHKFTLVDFWASWCKPCVDEIPHLKNVYNEFEDKGFHILSLSLDKNTGKWKEALAKLQMGWSQYIQTTNVAKDLFGVNGIPAYLLIDQKGKIIAIDILNNKYKTIETLRGEKLKAKVVELFKKYN